MDSMQLFTKKLGRRIAFLRDKKGFTQPQLAAKIDKDFQSISRIENGHINASAYVIKQLANALEVSMNEIFDFTDLKEKK
jgi:putative transcriptional regulator